MVKYLIILLNTLFYSNQNKWHLYYIYMNFFKIFIFIYFGITFCTEKKYSVCIQFWIICISQWFLNIYLCVWHICLQFLPSYWVTFIANKLYLWMISRLNDECQLIKISQKREQKYTSLPMCNMHLLLKNFGSKNWVHFIQWL